MLSVLHVLCFAYLADSSATYFGNPVMPYTEEVKAAFNMLTGMPFLQDATVVKWAYYMFTG